MGESPLYLVGLIIESMRYYLAAATQAGHRF